jgi:hypothetical protein
MEKQIVERGTDVVAVAAVLSPWWLSISEIAQIALPILGCLWLLLQMVFLIIRFKK